MPNRAEIIQTVADAIGAKTYLEIGVAHAETLLPVHVSRKIGVDPARPSAHIVQVAAQALTNKLNTPGGRFCLDMASSGTNTLMRVTDINARADSQGESLEYFQMTSDEYFEKYATESIGQSGIDVAFVDGLHEWRQVIRDVENCLGYLNDGGIIVMHDCSPTRKIVATPYGELEAAKRLPEWDGTWTGDVYRAVLWIRSQRPDLDVCVLDCDWGVGLLRRQPASRRLNFSEDQIANFPFEELDKNRSELLNLYSPQHLSDYVAQLPRLAPTSKTITDKAHHRAPVAAY